MFPGQRLDHTCANVSPVALYFFPFRKLFSLLNVASFSQHNRAKTILTSVCLWDIFTDHLIINYCIWHSKHKFGMKRRKGHSHMMYGGHLLVNPLASVLFFAWVRGQFGDPCLYGIWFLFKILGGMHDTDHCICVPSHCDRFSVDTKRRKPN